MLDIIVLCLFLLGWYFLLMFLVKGTDDGKKSELLIIFVTATLCMINAFLILFFK